MPTNGVDKKLVFDARRDAADNDDDGDATADDDEEVEYDALDGAKIALCMRISTFL